MLIVINLKPFKNNFESFIAKNILINIIKAPSDKANLRDIFLDTCLPTRTLYVELINAETSRKTMWLADLRTCVAIWSSPSSAAGVYCRNKYRKNFFLDCFPFF